MPCFRSRYVRLNRTKSVLAPVAKPRSLVVGDVLRGFELSAVLQWAVMPVARKRVVPDLIGILLILLFSVRMGLLPAAGFISPAERLSRKPHDPGECRRL